MCSYYRQWKPVIGLHCGCELQNIILLIRDAAFSIVSHNPDICFTVITIVPIVMRDSIMGMIAVNQITAINMNSGSFICTTSIVFHVRATTSRAFGIASCSSGRQSKDGQNQDQCQEQRKRFLHYSSTFLKCINGE